jgi:hypothetical protein
MFPVFSPGVENVAQASPTDSARSPSACAGTESPQKITGNSRAVREVKATKPLNCATSTLAVADKTDKKDDKKAPAAKPGFDPKPVSVGGDSIVERLTPHLAKLAVGLGGIAVILCVVFGVRCVNERGREKKTAKIAKVLDVADRQIRPPGVEPDPKAKEPTFANAKERAEAVLDAMAKNGTDVGGGAYKASLLLQAGKVDEAIAEYKKAQNTQGLDGVLAREGLGIAFEAKAHAEKDAAARQKDLEDALTAFKTMQPVENGPRYAYALYHQGRILALLGKTAEARTTLEKAKELGQDSDELPTLIEERLVSLGS